MLNKLKFIPLILISLVTFSFSLFPSSISYDYRLRISTAGDIWLFDGVSYGLSVYCKYIKYQDNPNELVQFDSTSFKINSFYGFKDPHTIVNNSELVDQGRLYKFLGFDSESFKYEIFIHDILPSNTSCVKCDTSEGKYFDSTTGLCVDKCEDITNQSDRLNCMCKRAGKIGYSGDFISMFIGGDGSKICEYGCETTKDDPEARPNGDGTKFNAWYSFKDTDPNANGLCFDDDTYAPNAMPSPNPKPDDPGNNNGTKPGGGGGKPDNPGNNNGTKPGGGGGKPDNPGNNNGTKPGGGGGKPDNPGNNNGTKPGNDGDKDNPKMDFSGYDKLTKTVSDGVKKVTDMYGDAKNQLQGVYDKIKNGSLSDFKPGGVVQSCPINKEFTIKSGLTKKISIDICAVVKDARPVLYFIFYALFLTIFSVALFKIVLRLI